MSRLDEIVGFEFHQGLFADLESRGVLKDGSPLSDPLDPLEFDVLEFFLRHANEIIPRASVSPLTMPASGRSPTDNYLSKIANKLGVKKREMFRTIRKVGYSLEANVRPIRASDVQKGGDVLKASQLNFNTHTIDSMRVSLQQTLHLLEMNPRGLPEAYITAAFNYINLSIAAYAAELPKTVMPEARRLALEAVKIDSKSSRAQGVLGLISLIYDYDWEKARTHFDRAFELNPDDPATLLSYGHYLAGSGNFTGAVGAVQRASQIDSEDKIIHASVGWFHLFAGEIEAAIKRGEYSKFLYPDFPPVYVILGWAYEAAHRYGEALEHYELSLEKEYSPAALASLAHLKAKLGSPAEGISALAELERLYSQGLISYVPEYYKALIFAGMGETENCLNALEAAFEQRCDWLIHLRIEGRWKPVKRFDRFKRLADKIGIPLFKTDAGK